MSEQTATSTQPPKPSGSTPPPQQKKPAKKKPAKKALTETFVPGQTKCKAAGCDHIVLVKNTKKRFMDEKKTRLLIERSVKCQGPNRHTYTIPEIVQVKKK